MQLNRVLSPAGLLAILCVSQTSAQIAEQRVGHPFYGDAPDATHPWAVHDGNRPQPPVVTPGEAGAPPSDAVVLFDGTQESFEANWILENPKAIEAGKNWILRDGAMESVKGAGYIRTKSEWGDCQLHVEWAAPTEVQGDSQGRGNSGVFLMGQTEVQVLDNYDNPSYPDGMAGSVYGIAPPMVNALRPPGEFQSYDIVFRRPIYKDGAMIDPGYVTVFVNGVLVQDHTSYAEGSGGHRGRSKPKDFGEKGPLKLQDHGNPVRFRNVWYRPLPPRATEGGERGILTAEATAAKRAAIAAAIREDAATLSNDETPFPQLLRTMESLIYAKDDAALAQVTVLSEKYLGGVAGLPKDQMESRKGEVLKFKAALDYLEKFGHIAGDHPAKGAVQEIIKANEWNKKK